MRRFVSKLCPWCFGTGGESWDKPCKTCHGSGRIRVVAS